MKKAFAALFLAALAHPDPPPSFANIAATAGIAAVMRCGGPQKRWIPEANGSGVAWLDYDNDGRMDLLIVNGGDMDQLRMTLAGQTPARQPGAVYLYHNLGNGHFEDVTQKAGLFDPYWGTGANAADYDNDGRTDILITNIGIDLLFHNNGDGTFTEVGRRAGLSQTPAWHTGSAFGDFDGDGKPDLFIASYIDIHKMSFDEPAPVCNYYGQKTFCGPIGLPGGHSMLYRNKGDGTFEDVSVQAGITAAAHGFGAVTGDFNGDGKLDLFVADDSDPNRLYLNLGGLRFREAALDEGVAFNADGRAQSNMGIAIGEFAGSGHTDVITTTFNKDYFPLFRQAKDGSFEEVAGATGLTQATSAYLGWACGLADFTNSGKRDFWSANGHVYPTDKGYLEPITVFRSDGQRTSAVFHYPAVPDASYRGGATADFDNDGKVDLIVLPVSGAPVLLHNTTSSAGHWIGVLLQGATNRDAIGAKVSVSACGFRQQDEVRSGGSYLSHNDPRLHFGLGECTQPAVEIQWPDGVRQSVSPPVDRYTVITEAAQ